MLRQDIYQRRLLQIISIEGLAALWITASIPGERSGILPGGFSPQRLVILLAIAVLGIATFLLSFGNPKISRIRNKLVDGLNSYSTLQAALSVFLLFFLFFPPIILVTDYQAIFHRLYFFIAWIAVTNLQLMIFRWIIIILENGITSFLQQIINCVKPILPWALCVLFPVLFLTPRLWVFGDHLYSVGNDFVPFSYTYKVYLLDFLVNFRIPLWSPSESVGFPFLASPHTQTLYPLNIPLAIFYWWKGSYGLLAHTWFTVSGISIFACGMYAWLRQFRWKDTNALLASLIISISFPMTELVRFPFAIHNFAWLPWILFYLTDILKSPENRKTFFYYLGLVFVLISFITAGYIYYLFYSIFLLVPYVVILLITPSRKALGLPNWKFTLKPLLPLVGLCAIPLIILSPYLINLVVTLFQVSARGIRDFNYSTEHIFSWVDILGSLVYPPVASPEGYFFIGFIPLSLLINYFITAKPEANADSQNQWFLRLPVKAGILVLIVFFLSLAMGKESPVFIFLWNHMPFFYSFRNWGRFCIMLLPVLGFGLCASFELFFYQLTKLKDKVSSKELVGVITKWTILFLGLFLLQRYALTFSFNGTWSTSFYNLNDRIWLFQVSLIASWIIILAVILLSSRQSNYRINNFVPVILLVLTFLDLFPVGAYQWLIDTYPEKNPPGRLNLINSVIPSSFKYPRTFAKTNISITPAFSMAPYPTWYFARYWNFFFKYSGEERIFESFLGKDNRAQKVFLTSRINYNSVADFMSDNASYPGAYIVDLYDGENLQLEVETSQEGFASFIDNWDPFWTVKVNGQPAQLEKLFDTFKSVKIPAGKSKVRFEYKPELFPVQHFLTLISN